MINFKDAVNIINQLSEEDYIKLFNYISKKQPNANTFENFFSTNKFQKGVYCPHCHSFHVVKNGHSNSSQKYKCKDCGKIFTVKTNSITAHTKKSISTWKKFLECMMNGFTVRHSAEVCGINKSTAFVWRHKVLDTLQLMANDVVLSGVIEGDETFFPTSYKGNHSKSKTFTMPRKAHKRGKQGTKRGVSNEKVCVPCAVTKEGLSIAKVSNLGRVSTNDLHFVFDNRIEKNSVLCTDKMNSYIKFAETNNIELIQLKEGKSENGLCHIQHINSYHSILKNFIRCFNGVSTKYLNNYLVWHNFVNYAKGTYSDKLDILEEFILTSVFTETWDNVPRRNELPIRNVA